MIIVITNRVSHPFICPFGVVYCWWFVLSRCSCVEDSFQLALYVIYIYYHVLSSPDIGPDVPDHASELDAKPRGKTDDPSHQKDPRQSYGVVGTLRVQSIATCDELAMNTVLLNFLGVCRQLWRTVYAGLKNGGQLHPGSRLPMGDTGCSSCTHEAGHHDIDSGVTESTDGSGHLHVTVIDVMLQMDVCLEVSCFMSIRLVTVSVT